MSNADYPMIDQLVKTLDNSSRDATGTNWYWDADGSLEDDDQNTVIPRDSGVRSEDLRLMAMMRNRLPRLIEAVRLGQQVNERLVEQVDQALGEAEIEGAIKMIRILNDMGLLASGYRDDFVRDLSSGTFSVTCRGTDGGLPCTLHSTHNGSCRG